MYDNCLKFNNEGSEIAIAATTLRDELLQIISGGDRNCSSSSTTTATTAAALGAPVDDSGRHSRSGLSRSSRLSSSAPHSDTPRRSGDSKAYEEAAEEPNVSSVSTIGRRRLRSSEGPVTSVTPAHEEDEGVGAQHHTKRSRKAVNYEESGEDSDNSNDDSIDSEGERVTSATRRRRTAVTVSRGESSRRDSEAPIRTRASAVRSLTRSAKAKSYREISDEEDEEEEDNSSTDTGSGSGSEHSDDEDDRDDHKRRSSRTRSRPASVVEHSSATGTRRRSISTHSDPPQLQPSHTQHRTSGYTDMNRQTSSRSSHASESVHSKRIDPETKQQMLRMLSLAEELDSQYNYFAYPVTEDVAPHYFEIVLNPMDFSTIRYRTYTHIYIYI